MPHCVPFWGAAADALSAIMAGHMGGHQQGWAANLDDYEAYSELVGLKAALNFAVLSPTGVFDQHNILPFVGGGVPSGSIAALASLVQKGLALDLNDFDWGNAAYFHPLAAGDPLIGWLMTGTFDPAAIVKAHALRQHLKDALDK